MGIIDDVVLTWRNNNYWGNESAIVSQYRTRLKERELYMLQQKITPMFSVEEILSTSSLDEKRSKLDMLDNQVSSLVQEGHLIKSNEAIFRDVYMDALRVGSDAAENREHHGVIYKYTLGIMAEGFSSMAWNLKNSLLTTSDNFVMQDLPGIVGSAVASRMFSPLMGAAAGALFGGSSSGLSAVDANRKTNEVIDTINEYNAATRIPMLEHVGVFDNFGESVALGAAYSLPIVSSLRYLGAKGADIVQGRSKPKPSDPIKKKKYNDTMDKVINSENSDIRIQAYRRLMEVNKGLEIAIQNDDTATVNRLFREKVSQIPAVLEETYPGQFNDDAKIFKRIKSFIEESTYKFNKQSIFINPTKEDSVRTRNLAITAFNLVDNDLRTWMEVSKNEGNKLQSGTKRGARKPRVGRLFKNTDDRGNAVITLSQSTGQIPRRIIKFTESSFKKELKDLKGSDTIERVGHLENLMDEYIDETYYKWDDIDLSQPTGIFKLRNNVYHKYIASTLPMDGFTNKHLNAIPTTSRKDFMQYHFLPGEGAGSDSLLTATGLGLHKVNFKWPEIIDTTEIAHLTNPKHIEAAYMYNRAVNHYNISQTISNLGSGTSLRDYANSLSDVVSSLKAITDSIIGDMSTKLANHRYKDKTFGKMIVNDVTNNEILRAMCGDTDVSPLARSVVSDFRKMEKTVLEMYSDLGFGMNRLSDFFISSFDQQTLEKHGNKERFVTELVRHMDFERTLGISRYSTNSAAIAKSFATKMYENILSHSSQVTGTSTGASSFSKKYYPASGSGYADLIKKFGEHQNSIDLIGIYADKHTATLARIQLYGDPISKDPFIKTIEQYSETVPRIRDSILSTLDFVYSGAFPAHENMFTETMGWVSSIKNAVNLLGSGITALTMDKATMALAIADATRQNFLAIKAALLTPTSIKTLRSLKPESDEYRKAYFFSEGIARYTVGMVRDQLIKAKRSHFDETMASINGTRAITKLNFYSTEYTITHAWYENGKSTPHPEKFGITQADWDLFMTSDAAVTSVYGIGIRHPRAMMVRGNTKERAAARKIGNYLSSAVHSGVLNSLDTFSRKLLSKGRGFNDIGIGKLLAMESFVYASAPLQTVTRLYPMMLRMIDRGNYTFFASAMLLGTAMSFTRDLIKDLAKGQVVDDNLEEEVLKSFVKNDLIMGYYGQAIFYRLFESKTGNQTTPLPPSAEALSDVMVLVKDLYVQLFTTTDPKKKKKVLRDIRIILERDLTIKRYPIIGAYIHRHFMDAIFSGTDSGYDDWLLRKQQLLRQDGYNIWWGEVAK